MNPSSRIVAAEAAAGPSPRGQAGAAGRSSGQGTREAPVGARQLVGLLRRTLDRLPE